MHLVEGQTPPTCDTHPYRGHVPTAYAGRMTVVPAVPIVRAYNSRPSYRQRLWLCHQTFEIDGPLAPLVAGSRPWPGKPPNQGVQGGQIEPPVYSWTVTKGARSRGRLDTLVALPRRLRAEARRRPVGQAHREWTGCPRPLSPRAGAGASPHAAADSGIVRAAERCMP